MGILYSAVLAQFNKFPVDTTISHSTIPYSSTCHIVESHSLALINP